MQFAQLRALVHVAETGSLSRASAQMRLAQPSLSRQIRLLEEELGTFLFERHGRGMVLTAAGRDVLDHAQRVLAELDEIREATRSIPADLRGTVALGTPPTVAEIVTVPLIARVRARHPKLSVRLTSGYSGYLLDWLRAEELDLMLSYDLQPRSTLRIRPLMVETLLLIRPGGAAGGGGTGAAPAPLPFSDLARLPLILPSARHGLRQIMERCASEAGIALNVTVEADAFGSLVGLVRAGLGATILPLAPIYRAVQAGELSATPLIAPSPTRKLVMVTPADRPVSPAAAYLSATVTDVTAELVKGGIWAGHMLTPPGEA